MALPRTHTFSKPHAATNQRLLFYFMVFWMVLNLVQGAFVPVDADEAYYWLYSRHLAWGYFDHPPVVALLIKLGETFGHGAFYTRMGTALLSAGTVYFGFKALPERLQDVRLYLVVFASITLFHVYGFITTPDAALLFFTTVFFYAYKRYLESENLVRTLVVAASIAALLYSKYHGVLPVFFTLVSNPKLLKKGSAWAAVLVALLLFAPHLWWQFQHNWPTFRYHLTERIASNYRVEKTLGYIAAQLFIWGPFTTIPALYFFTRQRHVTVYERAHLFTFWGVLAFFFVSSFRSTIEAHWTLVAGPSFVVLLLRVLTAATPAWQKRFWQLLVATIVLIGCARILFVLPASPVKKLAAFKDLASAPEWTRRLYQQAQNTPVVFISSYRLPALYQYYNPKATTWAYNTVTYRKTQYNVGSDLFLNGQRVMLVGGAPVPGSTIFLKSPYDTLRLQVLPYYKSISALKVSLMETQRGFVNGQPQPVTIQIENEGTATIETNGLYLNYTFLKTRSQQYTAPAAVAFADTVLLPGYKKSMTLLVQPPPETGTYHLLFSVVQPPLDGSFASPFYKVSVR